MLESLAKLSNILGANYTIGLIPLWQTTYQQGVQGLQAFAFSVKALKEGILFCFAFLGIFLHI